MPIHGLGPVGSNKQKKSETEGKEEFSVGGATSSTAVLRPNQNNDLQDIIRNASQAGAPDPSGAGDRNIGIITIYANGFQLGEEEFQDASDPANAAAIKDLKSGNVPASLEAKIREQWGAAVQSVGVKLVDKSSETFDVPKPKFNFSKSQGTSLGGSSSSSAVDLGSLKASEYKVDEGAPKTTIQVVTHDRKRVRVTINQEATVGALYQHVMHATGQQSFTLSGGFPPKPLSNYGASIKEAGLVGASVNQRL